LSPPGWLVRAALVAISVVALGWLAVLLRDYEVGQAASNRLGNALKLSPAEFDREMQRLRDAELLNPESKWELRRGRSWLARNRPRQASRVVEGLLRREPDNLEALFVLLISRRIYHGPTEQTLREIRRRDPLEANRRPGAAPR
jgi:hypothetical protein